MAKCGDGAVKVLQVAGCADPGWRAVFEGVSGKRGKSYTTESIAAWLLVDHGGHVHLHPACPMGSQIEDATTADNFLGVAAPDEDVEKLVRMLGTAQAG